MSEKVHRKGRAVAASGPVSSRTPSSPASMWRSSATELMSFGPPRSISRPMSRRTTASAVTPNIRSAAGLSVSMLPLSLSVRMPNSAQLNTASCRALTCLTSVVGSLLLGHVAANEEVLLLRLRPHTHPGERDRPAGLADVAALEVADHAAAPRHSHLPTGVVQIVGIDELAGRAADHLLGLVTEDRHRRSG